VSEERVLLMLRGCGGGLVVVVLVLLFLRVLL
jgi:hypothetical protein